MAISMYAVCLCHHEFIVIKIKLVYDGWVVYIYCWNEWICLLEKHKIPQEM